MSQIAPCWTKLVIGSFGAMYTRCPCWDLEWVQHESHDTAGTRTEYKINQKMWLGVGAMWARWPSWDLYSLCPIWVLNACLFMGITRPKILVLLADKINGIFNFLQNHLGCSISKNEQVHFNQQLQLFSF